MKKTLLITSIFFLLSILRCASVKSEEEHKQNGITSIIKEPIKIILAPIRGEGLVDLVFMPAETLLGPVILDFGDIVTTPGRTKEYLFNINKNISIVNEKEIENVNPANVQQLLQSAPGVMIDGFLGNAKDATIDIRGFGEIGALNYVVLVDGRRTNQIDLSGSDLAQIDVDSIERIEIIRGANSVLYGDNATGGVVNIITKGGREGNHVEYKQEFGSYQSSKEYFSVNGSRDFMDYFLSYSYQDSEGYRLNNALEANDIFTRVRVRPSSNFDIDFSSSYHRDWYGQPGALFDGNLQRDGREGSRSPNSKAKTEDYYFTIVPTFFAEFGGQEAVVSSFFSFRSRRSNSRDVSTIVFETDHHISSIDLRPKVEINADFFEEALENKLVFGTDYFMADDKVLSGNVAFAKSQIDIVKETLGIYASDNMLIDKRFIINGGIRGEWAKYTFDQNQPSRSINKEDMREIAFDGGLGYKYNDRSQIYFNYARSYRYPSTDELFQSAFESFDFFTGAVRVFPAVLNTSIKQQVGNNYEVGIKDNSFDSVKLAAAYYLIDNKNEIFFDPITFQNRNYHHTIHHGLEVEAKTEFLNVIDAYLAYTFQKSFYAGGVFAGNNIPLVPENKVSGGVNIKPLEGLNMNFTVNYISRRHITSDQQNTLSPLKGYTTMDISFSYKLKDITFFGTIRNITGEKYFLSATRNFAGNPAFYPAPERNFVCGMSYEF